MKRLKCVLAIIAIVTSFDLHAFSMGEPCELDPATNIGERGDNTKYRLNHRCVDSRRFDFGYQRAQRFDREGTPPPAAFENRAFLSYRTNARAFGEYTDADCGTLLDPQKCAPKLTYEFDGLVSLGLDEESISTAQGRASLYWPLFYENDQGIYDPYDAHSLTLGVSGQIGGIAGALLETEREDIAEARLNVFFKYQCLLGKTFGDFGNLSSNSLNPLRHLRCSKYTDTGNSFLLEGGVSIVESGGSTYDRTINYLLAEAVVDKKANRETTVRLRYADAYDNDLMDSERLGAELSCNFRLPFTDHTATSDVQLRLDISGGYEKRMVRGEDESSYYLQPSIYFRYAPGQRGPEMPPFGEFSPGGPVFSWP